MAAFESREPELPGPLVAPAGHDAAAAAAIAFDGGFPFRPEHVLALQRSAGNRAVARVLRFREGAAVGPARLMRQAPNTLGSVDPKVRQTIQVATAPVAPDAIDLDQQFGGIGTTALPAGTQAAYGPNVPKKLEKGLSSVAAELLHISYTAASKHVAATGFGPNTSIQVALDLKPYGGVDGVWRFTYYLRPKPAKGGEILIELLGASAAGGPATAQSEQRFKALGFTVTGFGADERAAVLEAVSLVPDAALARLRGLTFTRSNAPPAGTGDEGAWYDVNRHTVVVFDKAFLPTLVRHKKPGAGFSSEAVRAIVHELGHAVDMDKFRAAQTARKPGVPGESGMRFGEPVGTAPVKTAFADAVAKDGGTAVTAYGKTNVGEHYAEAFSLYITDPELLKTLRPNVFQYFDAQFAAKAAPTGGGATGTGTGTGSGSGGRPLTRQPKDAPPKNAPDPKDVARAFGKRLATDRAGVLSDLAKLAATDREALQAVASKALPADQAELLRRCIAFVGQRPAPEQDKAFVKVGQDPGKLELEDTVGGDKVEVRTGMRYGFAHNVFMGDTFSVTYRGKGAAEARLLQFVWREVVGHHPTKPPATKPRKIPLGGPSGKGYDLTTDEKKPNWSTDGTPFRETGTAVNRKTDLLAVFDSPDARVDLAARAFDNKADPPTKVISRVHLTTYMVRGMDILQAAEIDIAWDFPGPGKTPVVLTPVAKRRANRLDPAQRAVLVKQYASERLEYLP